MTFEQILGLVGALGAGAVIGGWLIKQKLSELFKIVDRVPPAEWFVKIDAKLDELIRGFDPDRLREHYAKQNDHANVLQRHTIQIGNLEREAGDHETRIRKVESS